MRPKAGFSLTAAAALAAATLLAAPSARTASGAARLAERPVQALIPRARAPIVMDGSMTEWQGAFQMPVNAGHSDWQNRAAVWSLLWDDRNLYVGLRCLDEHIFNAAGFIPSGGDGVEFYLDTRGGADLGRSEWTEGTLHLFYAPSTNAEMKARVELRTGIPAFANMKLTGVQAASGRTPDGYELEFKLPWQLFPQFKPAAGREIGLDLELSSGDGGERTDRCWVFGGVEAVQTPAVFGRLRLADTWDPAAAGDYTRVLLPAMVAYSHAPHPGRGPAVEPALVTIGISPALQELVEQVELTVSGRPLPMAVRKSYGPGWQRVQTCLIGFTNPQDKSIQLRALARGGRVIGEYDIPLGF
jgi:hypothetical protein